MEAPFDFEDLAKDLSTISSLLRFHLAAERPVPPDLAERLLNASETVEAVMESLWQVYGVSAGGWTVYAPKGSDPNA